MKRLKIAEQLLLVLIFALIFPLIIASAIIINVNQIAVRKELVSTATIIATNLQDKILTMSNLENNTLYDIAYAYKNIQSEDKRNNFINELNQKDKEKSAKYEIIHNDDDKEIGSFSFGFLDNNKIYSSSLKLDKDTYIKKTLPVEVLEQSILSPFIPANRQIYILDNNKKLIMSLNYDESKYQEILKYFPSKISAFFPVVFDKNKNEPNVVLFYEPLDFYIVVSSPEVLTNYGIVEARRKIILSILIAAIAVFIVFGIYSFSLYTTIRQFFKTIKAIAEGNYSKKFRVIKNLFTSAEVIFIANEFNKMIEKIDEAYNELNEMNEQLKKTDEYKSNLIDTVSHEFRTPLTSIKGYTSRLLRHDVKIDEETRKKSLKTIKEQAERLSRMVEDLLVIPDIESATLRMNFSEVNLKDVVDTSILSTTKGDTGSFLVDIPEDMPTVYADKDRLIQIFVNLLENANKYAKENTNIVTSAYCDENFAYIKVHNEAEPIPKEKLDTLFEKFARVETNLTRTTRGTGLGLFIVKGLVENMGGSISLNADNGFDVKFSIPLFKEKEDV